ncbi:MAG: MATE family efflux transporter [[Eubacterium] brachy]|jgi:MATE efflux family protein|nr:MATE family efflux transporter [[Eubacterium] brachy]
MDSKTVRMGYMPVGRLLATMSGPAIFSMLINALYNIIDSIFVAQIGEDALTAVTIGGPIQFFMVSMGVGTGVGINSLISRRLGAKKFEDANNAANSGLKLAMFNWLIFLVFGIFFAKSFIEIFSNDPSIVKQGVSYLSIVTVFSCFCMLELLLEKTFQATGNMVYPMITMITGALVNTIVDPILIFGLLGAPKLGVTGAAISTVFAQFVSMSVGIYFIKRKNTGLKVNLLDLKIDFKIVKEIYKVGAPSIIMQSLSSVMLFGINIILAAFSSTAVAVMGIYGRLQMFIFMPVFGINQGALPIMGYNFGAKSKKRLMDTYKLANIGAFTIMSVGLLIMQIFPDLLLKMFNASPEMYEIGIKALRSISWCFLPAGYGIITAGMMQATGYGFSSMWGSIIRQFFGILPLAYIFGKIGGLDLVWWAFPSAEILGLLYYMMFMYILNKRAFSKL